MDKTTADPILCHATGGIAHSGHIGRHWLVQLCQKYDHIPHTGIPNSAAAWHVRKAGLQNHRAAAAALSAAWSGTWHYSGCLSHGIAELPGNRLGNMGSPIPYPEYLLPPDFLCDSDGGTFPPVVQGATKIPQTERSDNKDKTEDSLYGDS